MMLLHCLHPKKNNEIYKQIITFSHLYYEECDRAQEIESNFSIVYGDFFYKLPKLYALEDITYKRGYESRLSHAAILTGLQMI